MPFELPIKTIQQPTGFERWLTRIGVCAYCRAESLELKYDTNGVEWRQCLRCAVVFVTPTKRT
jgi:hypothetical protein